MIVQFVALVREHPKASPGGKLSKIDSQRRFLTDEECGQQSHVRYIYQTYCVLVLHAIPHPALRATFPPGEGTRLRR